MGDETFSRPRLETLDMLRAVAALLVLLHHVLQVPAPSSLAFPRVAPEPSALGPFGSAGVDLFFVISGFVIAHSLAVRRTMGCGGFLLGRALRILPLFWIVTLAHAAQLGLADIPLGRDAVLATFTLIPLTGTAQYSYPLLYVGWSLGFEFAFYLIAGATLLIDGRPRIAVLLGGLLALAAFGALAGPLAGPLSFFGNAIIGEFALGVVAWLLWKKGVGTKVATGLAILGGLLLVSGLFIDFGQGFETDPAKLIGNETSAKRALIWGLPAAMLLLGMAGSGLPDRWLYRAFARLGEASYSLYLVHPLVLFTVDQAGLARSVSGDLAFVALLGGLSIAAALLLHHLVEKPIMRRARAITRPSLRQSGLRQAAI